VPHYSDFGQSFARSWLHIKQPRAKWSLFEARHNLREQLGTTTNYSKTESSEEKTEKKMVSVK